MDWSRLDRKEDLRPLIEPIRRNVRGACPTRALNSLLKYAGSSYPTSRATTATGSSVSASNAFASFIRVVKITS